MHVRHHLTRRGFTGRVLTITAAIAATISLSTSPVLAAGPWTVSNPQGTTWTAPAAGSVLVRIAASDGYPGRETVVQAHELVVLRTAGVEVGRTPDLPDRVASATAAASFTVVVSAGQVLEVVHSSKIGLVDGTPNSVSVSTRFDFTPTPATTPSPTTVAPSTTVASSSTIAVPAPSPSSTSAPTTSTVAETAPTTAVAVGAPPVPPAAVVDPPRPPRVESAPPVYALPETGRTTEALVALALLVTLLGGLGVLLGRTPRAHRFDPTNRYRGLDGLIDDIRGGARR